MMPLLELGSKCMPGNDSRCNSYSEMGLNAMVVTNVETENRMFILHLLNPSPAEPKDTLLLQIV